MTGTRQTHVRVDDHLAEQGERRASIELAGGRRHELWYRRDDGRLDTSSGGDPFLLGSLLLLMGEGAPVHVHAPVSRRLLAGVTELQAVWSLWKPDRYRRIDITVDEVIDTLPTTAAAVTAFSGGVDAGYTARRHLTGAAGWQTADLRAALLVHGLDVPLEQPEVFKRARARASAMLAGTGLDLVSVATNLRDIGQDWEDCCGLAVASCLTLLSPDYGVGLIGSSVPYDNLAVPWGSTPITDHLASGGHMEIRHDASGATRADKVELLAQWPQAAENLRVCWQGENLDRNCGRCEKCVRTILNFRAVGAGLPACFDTDVSDADIRRIRLRHPGLITDWRVIVETARRRGHDGPWVQAAESTIRRSRMILRLKQTPPGRIARRVVRRVRD